jgi:uncharacterized protein
VIGEGNALIVFARLPEPGRVKTRLTPLLTASEAAELYEAFLRDALDSYTSIPAELRIYLACDGDVPAELISHGSVHFQRGEGLGERMLAAFVEAFLAGYERVVVVGTDHPTLPLQFIDMAFEHLRDPRAVAIGPCDDGGFYLLGMNDLFAELFRGMTYSHAFVFEETMERAAGVGVGVTVLPPWYDVDTPEDLMRLIVNLDRESAETAARTRAVISKLRHAYAVLR